MTSLLTDYGYAHILKVQNRTYNFGNHICSIYRSDSSSEIYFKAVPVHDAPEQNILISAEEANILEPKLKVIQDFRIHVANLPVDGALGGAPGPLTYEESVLLAQIRMQTLASVKGESGFSYNSSDED
jgi:hypothetical protein